MRFCGFLCLLTLCSSGCVRTAIVKFSAPAEIDVTKLNRVVVMDFVGDKGTHIATDLSEELSENDFYEIVDQSRFEGQILPASFMKGQVFNFKEALGPERSRQIDGVIVGEVLEYRCEDKQIRNSAFAFTNGQADQRRFGMMGNGNGMEIREVLVREGTVALAFRLVDVQSGEIRASRRVSRHYEGRQQNGVGELPSREEVLRQLTEQCLTDIVEMLAPHEATSQIILANCDLWTRGRREVKQGIEHAQNGDWNAAEQKWQLAIEVEPNNHAALFNLAIVADARGEYDQAEDFAMQALRLQHKDCYAQGLETIRSHRSAQQKTEHQRDAQSISMTGSPW